MMLVLVLAFSACQQENVVPNAANAVNVGTQEVVAGDTTAGYDEDEDEGEEEDDDDDDD